MSSKFKTSKEIQILKYLKTSWTHTLQPKYELQSNIPLVFHDSLEKMSHTHRDSLFMSHTLILLYILQDLSVTSWRNEPTIDPY